MLRNSIHAMKTISFLSRFTIFCNICFILFAFFGLLESSGNANALPDTVGKLPYLKELIIILGFPAIVINLLMCFTYGVIFILKKKELIPKWMALINVGFLIVQFYYYFFLF